jgi:hypothetical protein
MKLFSKRLSHGQNGQDIVINFLEKHFGYRFIAGERYGVVENIEFIEEVEHCEYIPPDGMNGSRLFFTFKNGETDTVTIPDVFMENINREKFYWVEVKRHTYDYDEIMIDKSCFDDYERLYEYTRNGFVVVCLNPIDDWYANLYVCNISTLINNKPEVSTRNKNEVYVWSMSKNMVRKNRYPIKIENYSK